MTDDIVERLQKWRDGVVRAGGTSAPYAIILADAIDELARLRAIAAALRSAPPDGWSEAAIKHMVDRFLIWRLPENFQPDGGISFEPYGNAGTQHQYKRGPSGTNLLDVTQAEAMVRHMIEGLLPSAPSGWRLVPEEPTPAMIEAVLPMYERMIDGSEWPFTINVWRKLLAAAPTPPSREKNDGDSDAHAPAVESRATRNLAGSSHFKANTGI